MQKQKIVTIFFSIGIMGLLSITGLVTFFGPQKTFSENENRYLSKVSDINWRDLQSGKAQSTLTQIADDQFPYHDFWMQTSTEIRKIMGKQDIGGVYLGKDHYYFEKILDSDFDKNRYYNNLRLVAAMQEKLGEPIITMLVPSPATIYKDKLPKYAIEYDSSQKYKQGKEIVGKENWLDIRTLLEREAKQQQVYFRTDHHWTMSGAFAAYKAFMEQVKESSKPLDYFDLQEKSNTFFGTLYSKALDKDAIPDTLFIPENIPSDLQITCDEEKHESIYDMEKLNTKDKYAVFFGGNHGITQIINPNGNQDKTLVIIKDSFANCFTPMLIEHYQKIIMLDLRYYNDSVSNLLSTEKNKTILVLFEISNFAKETNLHKLMS
ncbi:MAG: hypothetical protein HFJ09_12355 [Lachnospiraceae bacterium]|nr:hypothetical protein [Lachnospiraceae bacterium]